jgi:uncharacterized protein YcbK (DUF882 family)
MNIGRRAFLRNGTGALLATASGIVPAMALAPAMTPRMLALRNLHTGDKVKIDYWANGSYQPTALAKLNHALRDWRNNEVHPIDPKLFDLVHTLQGNLQSDAEVEIISGYRSPVTNAAMHAHSSGVAAKSLHMKGMAMDIRIPGQALDKLHNAALKMAWGGVGYYPTSDFVHVDVGRVRKWNGV